jgi:hypothetical protein
MFATKYMQKVSISNNSSDKIATTVKDESSHPCNNCSAGNAVVEIKFSCSFQVHRYEDWTNQVYVVV